MKFFKDNFQIITTFAIATIVIIACVIQPLVVFVPTAFAAYLIYRYNKDKQQTTAVIDEQTVLSVYKAAGRVFQKVYHLLQIEKPMEISDLYSTPQVVLKCRLPFIRTKIRVSAGNKEDETTIPSIIQLLNQTLYNAIACGNFDDLFPIRSSNGYAPIILVESVFFESGFLVVDWAVNNNPSMYNYLSQRFNMQNKSNSASNMLSRDDEDF